MIEHAAALALLLCAPFVRADENEALKDALGSGESIIQAQTLQHPILSAPSEPTSKPANDAYDLDNKFLLPAQQKIRALLSLKEQFNLKRIVPMAFPNNTPGAIGTISRFLESDATQAPTYAGSIEYVIEMANNKVNPILRNYASVQNDADAMEASKAYADAYQAVKAYYDIIEGKQTGHEI